MATTQRKTVEVGGVKVTTEQVREAIDVLTAAAGVMIAQPLRRAGHPLASCDYHQVAADERVASLDATMSSKIAFIAALERALA